MAQIAPWTSHREALRRATGLTVIGGRYVYVRGLGDRYSATLLSGSTLPSPEPEKRVVPLDLFPTSLLEGVVIQKTCAAKEMKQLGIEAVGTVPLDLEKASARFPRRGPGEVFLGWDGQSATVYDVGISDTMAPTSHDWDRWYEPRGLVPADEYDVIRTLDALLG